MKSDALSFIRLGDIADFRNGLNFSKENHGQGCPLIGVGDFKDNFSPKWNELEEINPDGVSKVEDYLKEGDLLFVRSNGNKALVGRSLYINKDVKALYSGFCIRARLKTDDVSPLFLAYFTKTQFFRDAISFVAGTNINNLNQSILSEVRIPKYSKEKQAVIVDILSSLDDKIALNNRFNAELEAMAKTLYDYWFVQFDFPDNNGKPYKTSGGKMVYNDVLKREIPDGWSVKLFSELGFFKNGINYDPKDIGDSTAKIVNVRNISASTFFLKNSELDELQLNKKDINKYLVTESSMLIARSGTPGAVRMLVPQKGNTIYCGFIISMTIYDEIELLIVFFRLKNLEQAILSQSSGSILKNVSQDTLKLIGLARPCDELLKAFNDNVSPMMETINSKLVENEQLVELRDWLLPMLMNGQVTVNPSTELKTA